MSSVRSIAVYMRAAVLALGVLLGGLAAPSASQAQPATLPQPAPLPSFNPLCDSNLVPCLDIDEFAAHAFAHLLVLPRTELRDSAAVVPYGISLGLLGRIAGGVSTHYAFWQEGDAPTRRYGQHGPLRLSLSALLWPLLPLRQAPVSEQSADGESSFVPPRHLRIGLLYEHELRVGPFDGANQLGMLSDLAALRVVASRSFGPIEITTSAGALFDWRGTFATGEGAVQLGVYLPFFKALKLYGEALGRGGVAYVQDGVTLPARDPDPLRAQGVLGLGLSFRPQARVDLGVSAQMGLGGLAPSTVLARFAVLSVGKTYQGRAATPIAQMAGDAAADVAAQLRDYIQSLPIDPKLDEQCVLRDDNGDVMGSYGKRTPDGTYCEKDGFKVRIGEQFDRPPDSKDRICRDKALTECVLELRGKEWVPIRRPRLDGTCMLRDRDGTVMGRWGEPTPDGERCRLVDPTQRDPWGHARVRERKIGEDFYTDAQRSRVCDDPALTRCFVEAKPGGTLAWSNAQRVGTAFTEGMRDRFEERLSEAEGSAAAVGQLARDIKDGRVTLGTVADTARKQTARVVQGLNDALKHPERIKKIFDEKVEQIRQEYDAWEKKPPEEKLEELAGAVGRVTVDAGTRIATGALNSLGGFARGARKAQRAKNAAEAASTASNVAKGAATAGAAVEHRSGVASLSSGSYSHRPQAKQPHRNRADDRPATLYEKYDKNGNFEKHGVTHHENPEKRYTKKEIDQGRVDGVERGPRKEMLIKERERVETNPGPKNREPWAGKRKVNNEDD